VLADGSVFLYLDKGSDPCFIPDGAAVQVDEVTKSHIVAEVDSWGNLLRFHPIFAYYSWP
jgi:hypothetical protein